MSLEQLVRDNTPEFLDVEITGYIEETDDGEALEVVQVTARHDGGKYGFEMTEENDIPDEIRLDSMAQFYERMIRTAIDE